MSLNIAAKYFIRNDVKSLLQKLTGFDLNKIFAPKFNPDLKSSQIQLLTQNELHKEKQRSVEKAKYLLQMPPFLAPRDDKKEILSQNESLNPLNMTKSNYMFIDISMDIPHDKRMIVVRESNGTLRKADHGEKEKMLQVYFPEQGRTNYIPPMFSSKNLENCLKMKHYLLILNKACVKFEPNDSEFIRVTHRVYEFVNEMNDFEQLRSTRFFGPMVFYLAWYKKLENILAFYLNESNVSDCVDLIKLYSIVHEKEIKYLKYVNEKTNDLGLIEMFIKHDLNNSARAELALRKIYENQETTKQVSI
ncbi:unnamed protein product [Brachionus calyciflorus]|uniref:28S ribosomal protein S22, mitochondrial n=1 Tax=Brachionus calyciflorus TaxID=104777 RepID=A0A813XF03_9BILA|nr:unnamed protein product [Brachionus calyciflorus]